MFFRQRKGIVAEQKNVDGLDAALRAFGNVYGGKSNPGRKRRKMSATSQAKIADCAAKALGQGENKTKDLSFPSLGKAGSKMRVLHRLRQSARLAGLR